MKLPPCLPRLAVEPAPVQIASGQVRLYVNLGRKDGATRSLSRRCCHRGAPLFPSPTWS
jgi:hypothetical protein